MSYYTATLDDGREVEVEFTVNYWGCPSNGWDEPGEAAEVELDKVLALDERDVELSAAESSRIEGEICEAVERGDYDDNPELDR